jgi:hypothetical protein
MDKDAEVFLKGLEEKRRGALTWRTFSTFYANSNGVVREHGVFLYEVNKHFWYEDFEHMPQLFGIPLPKPKNAEPYVKFEADFGPEDVKSLRLVKKSGALSFCKGNKKYEKLKAAGALGRLFCSCVTEIALNNGTVLYFELIDKTLSNKIENYKA